MSLIQLIIPLPLSTGSIIIFEYGLQMSTLYLCDYMFYNTSDNHMRVRLKPSAAHGSDYINASFIEVLSHTL